jgi:uncharacterized DUF497 family protein
VTGCAACPGKSEYQEGFSGKNERHAVSRRFLYLYYIFCDTLTVLRLRFRRFDWDSANLGHIVRYGISAAQVEDATQRGLFILSKTLRNGEIRYTSVGMTALKRMLFIVYTLRDGICRVVTAYPLKGKRAEQYAKNFKG